MIWLKDTIENRKYKKKQLQIEKPMFCAYNTQGAGGGAIAVNPSIKNWYYNNAIMLVCGRKFLDGYTSPQANIRNTSVFSNPCFEKKWIGTKYLGSRIHYVIRAILDDGWFIYYSGLDDYYIKGKSWYHEKHELHDGAICGYDQEDKTYSVLAYDQNWIFRVFKTPQRCFETARKKALIRNSFKTMCIYKPIEGEIKLDIETICGNLKEYLDSSLEKYPPNVYETASGTVVHDYIAMYLDKLLDESIPYSRMDRRVFRVLWEHKACMCERLRAAEDKLGLGHSFSSKYEQVVKEADNARMLYASHHMRRRDSLLPIIKSKVLRIKELEEVILKEFLDKVCEVK